MMPNVAVVSGWRNKISVSVSVSVSVQSCGYFLSMICKLLLYIFEVFVWMCMEVSMYIRIPGVYGCTYVCMFVSDKIMDEYEYSIYTYVCMYLCMHTYVCMHVCVCVCVFA